MDNTVSYSRASNKRFSIKVGKIKAVFLILTFMFFLSKYSFTIGGDGVSGNYAYILLPILGILFSKRILIPGLYFKSLLIVFTLIFLVATFYQLNYIDFFARRFISYLLFMSIFFYLFIEITDEMIEAFKLALIFVSLLLSFQTLITYIQLGGAALGSAAKDAVGGQRYGFVYIISMWVLFFQKWKGLIPTILKYSSAFIIFVGILLTFSRSSVVALSASLLLYGSTFMLTALVKVNVKALMKVVIILFLIVIFLVTFNTYFPQFFGFFDDRLITLFTSGGIEKSIDNPQSSEGFRVYMLHLILDFVSNNPFTGSGFLGVWILFETQSGSSHNQYTDILFRTGVIGFLLYLSLLFLIGRFLFQKDRALFWGYIGIIFYGFFHETFKESHGGFILTFLIGMLGQKQREKRKALYEGKPAQASIAP